MISEQNQKIANELFENQHKDDKADALINRAFSILINKKIYCTDEKAIPFIDAELAKVKRHRDRFFSGNNNTREYVLQEYPKLIEEYTTGGENNE